MLSVGLVRRLFSESTKRIQAVFKMEFRSRLTNRCYSGYFDRDSSIPSTGQQRHPASAKPHASMFRRSVNSKYCSHDLSHIKGIRSHSLNRKRFVESNFLSNYSSYMSQIHVSFTKALCLHVFIFVAL